MESKEDKVTTKTFKFSFYLGESESIGNQVDSIEFYRCRASAEEWVAIVQKIAKLNGIKRLSLSQCRINDLDNGQKPTGVEEAISPPSFYQSLGKIVSLEELNFQICDFGAIRLDEMDTLFNLTKLSLQRSGFKGKQLKELLCFPKLKSLSIGEMNAQIIGLFQNLTELTIRQAVGKEGCKSLGKLSNLKKLKIQIQGENDDGFGYICELSNLQDLSLCFNDTPTQFQLIKKLSNLKKLQIESKLNKKFAEGVSLLSSLNELLFEYDGSDESEGGDGVELLSKLKNLRILNLNRNYIGDKGAQQLQGLPNLEELYLDDNKIGAEGIKAINLNLPNLKVLSLFNNQIGSDGFAQLEKCGQLKKIYLNCTIDAPIFKGLMRKMNNLIEIGLGGGTFERVKGQWVQHIAPRQVMD